MLWDPLLLSLMIDQMLLFWHALAVCLAAVAADCHYTCIPSATAIAVADSEALIGVMCDQVL